MGRVLLLKYIQIIWISLKIPTTEIIIKVNSERNKVDSVTSIWNWLFLIIISRRLGIINKKFINEQKNKIPINVIMGFIEIVAFVLFSEFRLEIELNIFWELKLIPIPNKNKNNESKNIFYLFTNDIYFKLDRLLKVNYIQSFIKCSFIFQKVLIVILNYLSN